jgi:hypothetical protein
MSIDPTNQQRELESALKSLYELDQKLRTDRDYKKKVGYSTKKEIDQLVLIGKAISEMRTFHKSAYLERSILLTRMRLLADLCQKLINVIDKKLDLSDFVDRCIIKLKTYYRGS